MQNNREHIFELDLKKYSKRRLNLSFVMMVVGLILSLYFYSNHSDLAMVICLITVLNNLVETVYPSDINLCVNYSKNQEWFIYQVDSEGSESKYIMARDEEEVANVIKVFGYPEPKIITLLNKSDQLVEARDNDPKL